jgi:hypothetical protein
MAKRRKKASSAQKRAQNNMKKASKACKGLPGEEFQSCVSEQLTGTGLGQARRRRRRRW